MENLKIKGLQFNHVLITADYIGNNSNLVMVDTVKTQRVCKDIQRVLEVGPHVKDIKKYDKVIIDTRKLGAKNSNVIQVDYNKLTGDIIHADNSDVDIKDIESAFLITDREILFVLT